MILISRWILHSCHWVIDVKICAFSKHFKTWASTPTKMGRSPNDDHVIWTTAAWQPLIGHCDGTVFSKMQLDAIKAQHNKFVCIFKGAVWHFKKYSCFLLVDIQMRGFLNSPTVHYINNQSQEKLAQFTVKMENS